MPELYDDEAEPPLDPALERVQARLRRLMLIAASTLGLGFLAVVAAVMFRVSNLDRSGPADDWRATIEIPSDATILSTDVDGGRLALTLDGPDGMRVLVFDLATGRRLGETVIVNR
jgi:hypothetical protein